MTTPSASNRNGPRSTTPGDVVPDKTAPSPAGVEATAPRLPWPDPSTLSELPFAPPAAWSARHSPPIPRLPDGADPDAFRGAPRDSIILKQLFAGTNPHATNDELSSLASRGLVELHSFSDYQRLCHQNLRAFAVARSLRFASQTVAGLEAELVPLAERLEKPGIRDSIRFALNPKSRERLERTRTALIGELKEATDQRNAWTEEHAITRKAATVLAELVNCGGVFVRVSDAGKQAIGEKPRSTGVL